MSNLDEKKLFQNQKNDLSSPEFINKLKHILQLKTNIIDTVLYSIKKKNQIQVI